MIAKKLKNNNIREKKNPDGPLGHLSYEAFEFL